MIKKFLNLLSLGSLEKAQKKLGYDDLYHLYVYINLNIGGNGMTIRMEKDHVVNVGIVSNATVDDLKDCQNAGKPNNTTLTQFVSNGEAHQGKDSFWLYDGSNNNCQVFVYNLLAGNKLMNPPLKSFILQDVNSLMSPFVKAIAKEVTDTAGGIDKAIYGEGYKKLKI